MDVSSHGTKPGPTLWRNRLRPVLIGLAVLLVGAALPAPDAHGFTLSRFGFGNTVRLSADDIAQNGTALGRASEQSLAQGSFSADLTDFSVPVPLNIGGAGAGGPVTATVDRWLAFAIRLTNAERRRCLDAGDFDVRYRITAPAPETFAAIGAGGGSLRDASFVPLYRGGIGGRCPRWLFYGYRLTMDVEGAVAAGDYEAVAEVEVEGPGGQIAQTQQTLRVGLPGLLLLYYPNRIDVNLTASALAGALGASTACGGGYCLDLGPRILPATDLSQPLSIGLSDAAVEFNPIQTLILRDAIGARAVGCVGNRYDTATYRVLSASAGIRATNGVIGGIQSQPCGLVLRTGDLGLELDLGQIDGNASTVSATLEITVTGL